MLWQLYFIKGWLVTKAIFNIKWRDKFPNTLPRIKNWLSSQQIWLFLMCQLNESDTSNAKYKVVL
jgi:hypothetical protein